jgi:hypothetical protein
MAGYKEGILRLVYMVGYGQAIFRFVYLAPPSSRWQESVNWEPR